MASPPTARVIAVLELLAAGRPATVSDVARALRLNRSTTTAVLSGLADAGWVERLPNRGYVLGAGLLTVAEAVRARLPMLAGAERALRDLSERTGHASALSRAHDDTLTVIAVHTGPGRVPAGVTVGMRFPLRAPGGAAIMAGRAEPDVRAWLDGMSPHRSAELRGFLATIRDSGFGVWKLEDTRDGPLLDLLPDVAAALARDPGQHELAERVVALLVSFTRHGYTRDELAAGTTLPVSYLVAPVGPDHELQLGLLRTDVTPDELAECARHLLAAAGELGHDSRSISRPAG